MTEADITSWVSDAALAPAGGERIRISDPWTGQPVLSVAPGGAEAVARAVSAARAAFHQHLRTPTSVRAGWLERSADALETRVAEIAELAIAHIGKPRRAAEFEVRRGAALLRGCARQLASFGGETLPLDAFQGGAGLIGFTRRMPYGVVGAVTPFNAPVNLLLQKVAPALATGNAVIAKPSPEGSAIALIVADVCKAGGVPDGLLAIISGGREEALALAAHPDVALVTVTGGTAAGEALAKVAGAKPFVGELGGNSPNVVCADANLDDAVQRIVPSAFEASGQQCISTQRIIVEAAIFDDFVKRFVAATAKLKVGDPRDAATDVGPVVSSHAADRIEAMIEDARRNGGQVLCGPNRKGRLIHPTIIVEPSRQARVVSEEIFGPVAVILRAADRLDALRIANDCAFGLQGSCFTSSLETAFLFTEQLNCGSVWINEASRFRLDNYPFGGVGRSGFGREGLRYAMEEYTYWKFAGLRFPGAGAKP